MICCSDIVEYIIRKSVPAAKRVSSELELIPFISSLDRTDQFYQGILGVAVGLFPGDEVNKIVCLGISLYLQCVTNICLTLEFAKRGGAAI